jgi:hypothetical protein
MVAPFLREAIAPEVHRDNTRETGVQNGHTLQGCETASLRSQCWTAIASVVCDSAIGGVEIAEGTRLQTEYCKRGM